ncbi:MAG: tape measure protein [Comamonas sp.]|nr:tape measure protein [Comamonas sp.]
MSEGKSVQYTIGVKGEGLEHLAKLTSGLDGASAEAAHLKEEAAKVSQQLAAVGQQQQAIDTVRRLGEQSRNLGNDLERSTAEVERLGKQLAEKKEALSQSTNVTREAVAEEKALQREYDSAVNTSKKLSSALGDKRRALDSAKEAAKQLGLDTTQLAQAQKQVDQAAREAQGGLDSLADGLRRVQQRQADNAQISKAFQDDLRKLGLDGSKAPAGLEAAFKSLGINGVKKSEAAVRELQVALAQVRNSPDVLPSEKRAAVQAYEAAVAELRGETTKAAAATRDFGAATDSTGNTLSNVAGKAVALGGALLGLQQMRELATSVVETGSQFQNLEVRLENLLGGTAAATEAMTMLKELAASTPFDVAGLSEAYVKLTSFGLKPSEAQMRSLADITANLGGGTEALSGVTLALGQAWTKTKLQGEEILQLAERGVPVWDALARATGRTVPELQRMSEAGQLGRDVIAKLIDELGRMNAGASDKLMQTYAGAVANAKDALAEFFDMVAKAGVLDWLTDKIRSLLDEFDRMKQSGELEQKAKDIADAFLQIATMVDTTARALVDLAPVMEVAIKLFIALKVANAAQALWAMAAGARAATPAVAAAGAASAVSAGQMAAAGAAASGLATSLRILRSLTGIGLVLGAAELAQEFFRAKREAEEADAAVARMMQEQPVNGPKQAADAAAQSLGAVASKADDAMAQFDNLKAKGDTTAEALRKIGSDFDLSTSAGIGNAAAVLDALLEKSQITATQFRDTWSQALQEVNLLEFEVRARQALDGTSEGAAQLEQALEAGLREAIRRAGGDFELLSGGMGRAAQSAVADLDYLINNLGALQAAGVDTQRALVQSIGKGINTADSQKALDAVKARVAAVRQELGDKLADGLLDQAAKKAQELKLAMDGAVPGIQSVEEAMRQLGITTDASLKESAEVARKAYELIRDSGTATPREIAQAFEKAADAAEKSADRAVKSWADAERQSRKYLSAEQQGNPPGNPPAPAPNTRPNTRQGNRPSSAPAPQPSDDQGSDDYTQAEKDAIAEAEANGDHLVAAEIRRKANWRLFGADTVKEKEQRQQQNATSSQEALDRVKDLNTGGSDRDVLQEYGLAGRGLAAPQRGVRGCPNFCVNGSDFN